MRRVTAARLDVLARAIARDLFGRAVRVLPVRIDEYTDTWIITLHRPTTDEYATQHVQGRAAHVAAHCGALSALVEVEVRAAGEKLGLVPESAE